MTTRIHPILPALAALLALLALPCSAATEPPARNGELHAAADVSAPEAKSSPSPDDTATGPSAKSEDPLAKHRQGSLKLADEQDELNADVQQLVLEQTIDKVIKLLEDVEFAMDDATDRLEEHNTGGETIAAQTDVIEKIYEAAKQRQQSGGGQTGSAMMDMLENMMGKGKGEGKKGQGEQAGDQAGEGMTGESDTANESVAGARGGNKEERRVPKAAGTAGRPVPAEFRDALDAFNRGSESLAR